MVPPSGKPMKNEENVDTSEIFKSAREQTSKMPDEEMTARGIQWKSRDQDRHAKIMTNKTKKFRPFLDNKIKTSKSRIKSPAMYSATNVHTALSSPGFRKTT
jgi:hypothetical protein